MKRKKKKELKGFIQTGTIFIGDAGYMAGNSQDFEAGIIPPDASNPFKDWDAFVSTHQEDGNLELPGSFNGDLPGRGVIIQTNMFSGSYTVKKRLCKETGKVLSITVKFND